MGICAGAMGVPIGSWVVMIAGATTPRPMSDSPKDPSSSSPQGSSDEFDARFAAALDRLALFLRLRYGAGEDLDLVNDVYLRARAGFGAFQDRGPGSFLGWLCKIGAGCAIDWRRRGGRRLENGPVAAAAGSDSFMDALDRVQDAKTGPFTAAGRIEARDAVAAAIEGLEDAERDVLMDRYFAGLTQAEIAEARGVSTSAVQRSLAKALAAVGRPLQVLSNGQRP